MPAVRGSEVARDSPAVAEPGDARVTPEPHPLAPGERAGCAATAHRTRRRGRRIRRRRGARAPPCTRSPGGRCGTSRAGRGEAADLVDEAGVAHRGEALRRSASRSTGAVDRRAGHRTGNTGRAVLVDARHRTTRTAGRSSCDHLERAHDPARVAGLDPRRGRPGRRARARAYAAASPSSPASRASSSAAELEVLAREAAGRRRPPARRARCRRRAAPACRAPRCRRSRRAPRPGSARPTSPPTGSATSTRWCGDRGALGRRRLGGADVHAAVHLHRVDRDDLDVAERSREPRAPSADLPDAVGPTSARCVTARALPRGDRDADAARRRGRGRPSSSSPRSQCARRRGDRARRRTCPARASRPPARKCTSLFWRVRPDDHGRVLLRRALDQDLLDPTDPRRVVLARRAGSTRSVEPGIRSLHHLGGHEVVDHLRRRGAGPGREHERVRRVVAAPRRRPRACARSRRRSRPGSRR